MARLTIEEREIITKYVKDVKNKLIKLIKENNTKDLLRLNSDFLYELDNSLLAREYNKIIEDAKEINEN